MIVPSAIRPWISPTLRSLDQILVLVEHAGHVGQEQQPLGAERAGDRAGEGVGVDVVGLAVDPLRHRGEHRDQLAAEHLLEHGGVDLVGLADEAEVDDVLDVAAAAARVTLRAITMLPSLPHRPIARPPCGVDRADDLLVDRAGEHHLDDLDRRLVGDAQAGGELRLDAELVEHRADLRPAAVDDHRIDAGLLEQDHVAGEIARRSCSSPIAWPPYFTTIVASS